MCGGSKPQAPAAVDPAAERQAAADDAAASANAKLIAEKRRKRSGDNLLAALSDGLDTLGGAIGQGIAGTALGGGGIPSGGVVSALSGTAAVNAQAFNSGDAIKAQRNAGKSKADPS